MVSHPKCWGCLRNVNFSVNRRPRHEIIIIIMMMLQNENWNTHTYIIIGYLSRTNDEKKLEKVLKKQNREKSSMRLASDLRMRWTKCPSFASVCVCEWVHFFILRFCGARWPQRESIILPYRINASVISLRFQVSCGRITYSLTYTVCYRIRSKCTRYTR